MQERQSEEQEQQVPRQRVERTRNIQEACRFYMAKVKV